MRNRAASLALVFLLALLFASTAAYASDDSARALTDRMIAAHGGLKRWNDAPTVSFRKRDGANGKDTLVVVEQGRRRTYIEWPDDNSQLVSDGSRVWTKNYSQKAPPSFLVNLDYYFLGLPWFTRDSGVRLEMAGEGKLPGGTSDHRKVRMSFDAGVGNSSDIYTLFIDRKTNMLRGVEYVVTHPAIVVSAKPANGKFIGPFFRIYDDYRKVDGLMIATRANSVDATGKPRGATEYSEISFRKVFDESRMVMPSDAIVDAPEP